MKSIDLMMAVVVAVVLASATAKAVPVQPSDIPMEGAQPQIAYGARVAANDFYDAYYDGGYGAFTDGYWGTDGNFWYEGGDASSVWVHDEQGHFRHTPAKGFALVRGTGVQREN